ncbi:3-dehydroquinate synthase [Jannaschia sp. LMIT008]|uniref:3-dehydroquinate synthase n=1 Tax=Jannaschia maritima TaxID=3032585 RepID=UPI0028115FDF|nr:3-dehydroquinate synthase [Jannaschia sp. LMIT008]
MKADLRTVTVPLGPRTYDVRIGPGLIDDAAAQVGPFVRRGRVLVVTEERVADLWLDRLRAGLGDIAAPALVLPPGEGTKSWDGLTRCVEWILDARPERADVVLALGGGVIGDLAGFAAASVLRGLGSIQVPTSLLAQVDSSVGGKTAINTRHGKNLVGAFHQPRLVLADTGTLTTLPDRDMRAGYGEVVKYGLLGDAAFFDWLETNAAGVLAGRADAVTRAVERSVAMKADIVGRDETEAGDRALLNLGHTFAHALEAATGYSDRLLHGEAVALGCALAFDLSARLGLCSQEDPSRVRAHLAALGLHRDLSDVPGRLPGPEGLVDLMGQDKKVRDGRLRFVLARGIGQAFVTSDVPHDAVLDVLRDSGAA